MKTELLERIREHLADLHAFQCEERYHRAIYECSCETATDYREVKKLIEIKNLKESK